jgi:hypothetical protein
MCLGHWKKLDGEEHKVARSSHLSNSKLLTNPSAEGLSGQKDKNDLALKEDRFAARQDKEDMLREIAAPVKT